jgi:hypothetical protein
MSSTNNNAGCLVAGIGLFSRLMLLFYWLARPVQVNAALGSWFLACLGIIFDILNIVGAGAANRNRIPAGYPGSTQTPV